MEYKELVSFLETSGKDPSRLIFEDELTGLYNRRYLYHFLQSKVPWNSIGQKPISLLMLDLDHFKKINDNFGHETGDNALVWLAKHMKQFAGTRGIPIRYAGDEFMILLRESPKAASLQFGEKLIRLIRQHPFSANGNGNINLTISLGIATAPDDAVSGKNLIQKADTALYSAKQNGRDQLADAGSIKPEDVFPKTAIHKLDNIKIVGRNKQLGFVGNALKQFSRHQSPFLIAEGAAGIGKSEFLETICKNLARSKTLQVSVSGTPQEMYRSYYLTERMIFAILKQRKDKGIAVIQGLSPKERAYLKRLFPQLKGKEEILRSEPESSQREGLFKMLLRLVPKLVNERPLMLYVDDLHYADEATLLLLRQLLLKDSFPLFVCSSAADAESGAADTPMLRFVDNFSKELDIHKFSLPRLTAADIAEHIHTIFPKVQLPRGFDKELGRVSQGNPLFFGEILRKLVLDQKISLIGQQWVIHPIEKGYSPKSLEEIVRSKIAALDEESREVLDQVSAMGEDVPLSMLIGSSEQMEAKVLEFIDKAAAQGLLSSDFQVNDEVIRFLGKRVMDITYNAIEPERKEQLHERIGNYHESLYQQQLLSSAASLAYHFKRSTNIEKAGNYDKILAASNNRNFNVKEAMTYAVDESGEAEAEAKDVPLNSENIALVPKFIRDFMVAVRNIKLYPPGSKSIIGVISQTKASLDQILIANETLNLMQIKQSLVVNGQKMDITDFKLVAEGFLKFLGRFDLKGIAFNRGLTDSELELLIDEIGRNRQKMFDEVYWERFTKEQRIQHIDLKQVRYTISGKPEKPESERIHGAQPEKPALTGADEYRPPGMDTQELRLIPSIIKGLIGAARILKLYPLKSKAVIGAINQLHQSLGELLREQSSLTLAQAGQTLLVNGNRVDVSSYRNFADEYVQFLSSLGLSSLTFLKNIPAPELETFIGALNNLPPGGADIKFWRVFAKQKGLAHILFNKAVYEVKVSQTSGSVASGPGMVEQMTTVLDGEEDDPIPDEQFGQFIDQFGDYIRHIFEQAQQETIKRAVNQLYLGFDDRSLAVKERIINTSRSLLEGLAPAYQHDLADYMTDPLLSAFNEEPDQKIMVEMSVLLNRMVIALIGMVNYPSAARIFTRLRQRYSNLKRTKHGQAQILRKNLEIQLNSATQNLLMADLKSAEPTRQRNAAQLIESIGPVAWPLLINIIKQEDDLRARQTAALLLSKQGPKAVERLKRLLVLEITPEERVRVLSIIDTLTGDLLPELMHAIGDDDRRVQLAAFRLTERLKDNRVVGMLLESAKSSRGKVAVGAINTIEKLKPPEAVNELKTLMLASKEDALKVACCRALGQIAKPECIEPLETVLSKKSFLNRKHSYSHKLRATAAFALGNIHQVKAIKILAGYVNDPDQRVSEIAKAVIQRATAPADQGSVAVSAPPQQ